MSFEVGVCARFTATHHLVGDFGPASHPHAHDYRVEASVTGGALQPDGTLLDITVLQSALAAAIDRLNDSDLNTLSAFAAVNPTAEAVARHLFETIAPELSSTLTHLNVRVWESEEAFAAYFGTPATSRR